MSTDNAYTPTYREPTVPCVICSQPLDLRLARGRKSGKPFVMLVCGKDARHFRAFINDQDYVGEVVARMETRQ